MKPSVCRMRPGAKPFFFFKYLKLFLFKHTHTHAHSIVSSSFLVLDIRTIPFFDDDAKQQRMMQNSVRNSHSSGP